MRYALLLVLLAAAAASRADDQRRTFAVTPIVETAAVPSDGDAADDIAIWLHPTDRAKSAIIGTSKAGDGKGGLYLYGLDGKLISSVTGKRMNNVDGRYGFTLAGKKVDIFAATNRSDETADVFIIDPVQRRLTQVGSIPLGNSSGLKDFHDPYGIALTEDRASGRFYAFISDRIGHVAQFSLVDSGGKITGSLVRHWKEKGTAEGMVVDDATGHLYLGEELGGVYQYKAASDRIDATGIASEPPPDRRVIDTTHGHLTADVEGLAIYETADGGGYLLASSQGNNRFVIYDRKTLAYVATFAVETNKQKNIDGLSDTDGIDAASGSLGAQFPLGAFIAQDGANGSERQNFKAISWADMIEAAKKREIELKGESDFDPRRR